jgi:hypothetical protein
MTKHKKGKTPLRDRTSGIQKDVSTPSKDDATGSDRNQSGKDPPEMIISGTVRQSDEDQEVRSMTFPKEPAMVRKTVNKVTVETEEENSNKESQKGSEKRWDGTKRAVTGPSKHMMIHKEGLFDLETDQIDTPSKGRNETFLSDNERA